MFQKKHNSEFKIPGTVKKKKVKWNATSADSKPVHLRTTIYTVRPISFETVLWKPPKKILKNSKQIFLFKVIVINCNTLVGAIFQLMHRSQKISNGNSLQFRHCRYLNVAYGCIQLHFQIFNFRNAKVSGGIKSGEYGGWLSLLHEQRTVPIVLLSTHVAQIVYIVFVFFKSSERIWRTMVFSTLYSPPSSYN